MQSSNRRFVLSILICIVTGLSSLHVAEAQDRVFASNYSANLVAPGRLEASFLHAFRWGISPRVEISTQPILAALMPNLGLKISWDSLSVGRLSTWHTVFYPSYFLETVSREGAGGLLPEQSIIPFLLAFFHEARFTFKKNHSRSITARLGFRFALRNGESDMPTIDLPVVYHRTATYFGNVTINLGGTIDGTLTDRFTYLLDSTLLLVPGHEGRFAIELTGLMGWHAAERLALAAGYRLIAGEYPYGLDADAIPFFDIRWIIRK